MRSITDIQQPRPQTIEGLKGRKDPEAVKAVAKEMESLFAYELIKVMRETSGLSSKGSLGANTYMAMFDQEISKLFAERGLGLQDMLAKGLQNLSDKAEKNRSSSGADSASLPVSSIQILDEQISALLPGEETAQISSGYGPRPDPFTGQKSFHHGLDIQAPQGSDIHPVLQGTVVFSGEQEGYGNVVVIDHGNGFVSKYAHNQTNFVHEGQHVDTGSVIAQVGSSGRSTGPHVHFEVAFKGQRVDPNALLAQRNG